MWGCDELRSMNPHRLVAHVLSCSFHPCVQCSMSPDSLLFSFLPLYQVGVRGAQSEADAAVVARSVAASSLAKVPHLGRLRTGTLNAALEP